MKNLATFVGLLGCLFSYAQNPEIDSLKSIVSTQSGKAQIQTYSELSWQYGNIDSDTAIIYAKKGLEAALALDSLNAISLSLNSLASAYKSKGQYDSALLLHQESLEIKKELGDSIGIASSLNNIGIVYDELGKYNLSLRDYFSALKIYESFPEQEFNVAMVLSNIGIVYKKQKEFPKVIEYYEKALAIYEEQGSLFGVTVTKGNIGSVLIQTKDFEKSIAYSKEALQGYTELGYTRYIPYMKNNMGIAYDSLNQLEQAKTLYHEAAAEHRANKNLYELAHSLILLAASYEKEKQYELAIESASEAFHLADEIGAQEFKTRALKQWSESLASTGDFRNAYGRMVNYTAAKDSLFEDTKTREIFELQTQYETEKKEQQIKLQKAEISEQETELERRQTLLIASAVLILAIIALAFLQRSRLKKKQQIKLQAAQLAARKAEIQATISSQEKERSRYARDLHDGFGQMISILSMNLKNLQGAAKPDQRQKVFEESSKVIDDMYSELKNICFDLMPQTLIRSGLPEALKEFIERVNRGGKVFIELNVFGLDHRLAELQEISIYRISQEWINNILKYSDASKVTLQITKDDRELTLLIEDNGSGFDQKLLVSGKGNGWKNLNTRAKLIQAELELETSKGSHGTTLILNAPAKLTLQDSGVIQNTVEMV